MYGYEERQINPFEHFPKMSQTLKPNQNVEHPAEQLTNADRRMLTTDQDLKGSPRCCEVRVNQRCRRIAPLRLAPKLLDAEAGARVEMTGAPCCLPRLTPCSRRSAQQASVWPVELSSREGAVRERPRR